VRRRETLGAEETLPAPASQRENAIPRRRTRPVSQCERRVTPLNRA
jgi:hypothetical protein